MMTARNPGAASIGTRVFLSYSRRDVEFVDRLEKELKARGITVFIDRSEIGKGVDWWQRIRELIERCDTVVFVLSPDSVQSEVCTREVDYAAELGKRFVPIVYRELGDLHVPPALASINFVFFSGREPTGDEIGFETAVEQLVSALHTDIDWLREHTRMGDLARHWDATGRPADLLMRGDALRAAVDWLQGTLAREDRSGIDDTDLIHVFVQASAAANYRLGIYSGRFGWLMLPAILVVAALLPLVLVLVAWGIESIGGLDGPNLIGKDSLTANVDAMPAYLASLATVFALYVAVSVRRRYRIARRVEFRPVRAARWYALRALIHTSLWIGVLFLLVVLLTAQ